MGRPKTTCFAYEKVNGQSLCKALNEMVRARGKGGGYCPFYKTVPQYEAEAKKYPIRRLEE